MIHRYAEWTRRQGRSAECSPALAAAGVFLACCVVAYVYREVILKTIEVMVVAMVGVVMVVGFTALAVNAIRYYRRTARLAEEPIPDTWTKAPETATMEDEEAISAEADWLASGVELAFSPDGKTLKAK
jgi:hypothetical protein